VKPPPLVQAFSNLAWLNGRIIQLNRARIPPQPVSHTARRTRSDIGGRQQARNSHRPSQLREGDTSPALLPFGDRTERASECASFIIFFPLFASSRGRKKRGGELVAVARQFVVVFYWIAFCLRAAACTRSMHAAGPCGTDDSAYDSRVMWTGCGGGAAAEAWEVWKWSSESPGSRHDFIVCVVFPCDTSRYFYEEEKN
jgi:hypothetical protein